MRLDKSVIEEKDGKTAKKHKNVARPIDGNIPQ